MLNAPNFIKSECVCSIDAEENEADSEYEEDDEALGGKNAEQTVAETVQSLPKMSWLLQIALENLGVTVCNYIVSARPNR